MAKLPLQKAAGRLGVSVRTLSRWVSVGCPHVVSGRSKLVDLAEVARWKDAVGGRGKEGDHILPLTRAEGLRAAKRVKAGEDYPSRKKKKKKKRARKPKPAPEPEPEEEDDDRVQGEDDLDDLEPEELRVVHLRAKVRKDIAQARKHELDVEVRRGELLAKEEVERGRLQRITYARAVLLGGPSTLAPDLAELESEGIEDRLREWVRRVLRELAGGEA